MQLTVRPRNTKIVAALLVALVVAGCGQLGLSPTSDPTLVREHQQAQAALARWAAAVGASGGRQGFVPVGDLYAQIGDWEEPVGDNNKRALMSGVAVAAGDLPSDAPPDAEVRWNDGTTRTVHTMSAEATLEALRAAGNQDCQGCVPLRVTSARLSTAKVQTSRGPAIAPAWEFALQGTRVLVTRIAVDPHDGVTVAPPPWDPNDSPVGISLESATAKVGSSELTVTFTGWGGHANDFCGADYAAEAVESDLAVVVIVIEHRNATPPPGAACTTEGHIRTATVELAAPLGDRAVLEVLEGCRSQSW